MNQIGLLTKTRGTYFIQRLIEEVRNTNVLFLDPWSEGPVQETEVVLVRTSAVYGDDRDLLAMRSLRHGRLINSYQAHTVLRTKLLQYEYFERFGFPSLPFINAQSSGDLERFISAHPGTYLIKPHRGQGGWGIRTLSAPDLRVWFDTATDREYLVQPYQADAQELRLFFIKDWVLTLERRRPEGGAAANFRQEGAARIVPTPPLLLQELRRLRDQQQLHYGAMDVLMTKAGPAILEMNLAPGVEQLERISGENILRRLLDSL